MTMLLIDKPYISDFLIQTIKENHFKIIDTKNARSLVSDTSLDWVNDAEALNFLRQESALLYSVSENGLEWIHKHLPESKLFQQINIFKDKVKFRKLLASTFPEFYFKEISLEDIHTIDPAELQFPLVIKPAIGFLSIGVHIVYNLDDWINAKEALRPEKLKSIFPESVLNTSNFIIEKYIEGEEYAIDYYYDQDGKVVVLNILHHIFASGNDTSDRVYTTSKAIVTRYKEKIEAFLTLIGEKLEVKNFPGHAEVRIDEKGTIYPIEINPMRFGGWCTTADLVGISLGYNLYEYYFRQKQPDWDAIYKGKEDSYFSIIILNNNSGIDAEAISKFDYEKLAKSFENPRLIRKLNYKENPLFGFVFAETNKNNEQELYDILSSNLRAYIVTK